MGVNDTIDFCFNLNLIFCYIFFNKFIMRIRFFLWNFLKEDNNESKLIIS